MLLTAVQLLIIENDPNELKAFTLNSHIVMGQPIGPESSSKIPFLGTLGSTLSLVYFD